jgi:nucleotide-binding universal stress UspA family protein
MVQLKQVLCPVDFSDGSRHAFDRAIGIARSYGASLTVLHVLPVASAVPALPYGPEGPGPFGFEVVNRDRALAELTRFLAGPQPLDVPLHYEIAESASVYKEVHVQAARLSADLIVMGTHGRSGFDHLFLGSIAERTLRTSAVPVLVVPPRLSEAGPAGRDPFHTVLCAVDFSQDSARALEYATSLASHAAGRLMILHSVELVPTGYDPLVGVNFDIVGYEDALEKSARTELLKFVARAEPSTCESEAIVTRGKPFKEILRVASERHADVIVLGVHGRNALDRLVFGSTTEQLIRRATCPILAVPWVASH